MEDQDAKDIVFEAFGEPESRDDIETEAEFRDWVDAQIAEIKTELERKDDEIETKASREDVDTVAQNSAQRHQELRERMELLEAKTTFRGDLRKEGRHQMVLKALLARCQTDDDTDYVTVEGEWVRGMHGEANYNEGIYDLFDEAVSQRTCRKYIDQIAEKYEGCRADGGNPGGFGGGTSKKKLKMDVDEFLAAHSDEWWIP